MKRLISLLCALCLLFSFALAEDYATTNPYTIDDIGMTLALPDALSRARPRPGLPPPTRTLFGCEARYSFRSSRY